MGGVIKNGAFICKPVADFYQSFAPDLRFYACGVLAKLPIFGLMPLNHCVPIASISPLPCIVLCLPGPLNLTYRRQKGAKQHICTTCCLSWQHCSNDNHLPPPQPPENSRAESAATARLSTVASPALSARYLGTRGSIAQPAITFRAERQWGKRRHCETQRSGIPSAVIMTCFGLGAWPSCARAFNEAAAKSSTVLSWIHCSPPGTSRTPWNKQNHMLMTNGMQPYNEASSFVLQLGGTCAIPDTTNTERDKNKKNTKRCHIKQIANASDQHNCASLLQVAASVWRGQQ